MAPFSIFAPAKLNLFLAITGRRADGFHELVSVATPIDFGDTLHFEPAKAFSLACDDPSVSCEESNLVLKAARAFAMASGWRGGAKISLEKRVPMGAGLGGGSSDAVATLRALNRLSANALSPALVAQVAAQLGSDCPLFLQRGPAIMRGRGERIEPLPGAAAQRLRGKRVLIFKPAFGVPTAWAYARLAAEAPASYLAAEEAERRLAAWMANPAAKAEALLLNTMERAAFAKFVALPALLATLAEKFQLAPRMSGSGSACFAFLPDDAPVPEISAAIRAAWGDSAFLAEARLA